jgi:hypothetical protein
MRAGWSLLLYVDRFLADVLLDQLLVLSDVLADPKLLSLSMRGTRRAEVWRPRPFSSE